MMGWEIGVMEKQGGKADRGDWQCMISEDRMCQAEVQQSACVRQDHSAIRDEIWVEKCRESKGKA